MKELVLIKIKEGSITQAITSKVGMLFMLLTKLSQKYIMEVKFLKKLKPFWTKKMLSFRRLQLLN